MGGMDITRRGFLLELSASGALTLLPGLPEAAAVERVQATCE